MRLAIFDPHLWATSLRDLGAGWNRFWFTPADPLVLGLQRVCAGLVLTYVIVATTPLLPSVYAPDAVIDAATANRFRHENPVGLPPDEFGPAEDDATPRDGTPPAAARRLRPALRPELLRLDEKKRRAYFDAWGYDPPSLYDEGVYQFSPYFHLESRFWMRIVHGLGLAVAILFTLGLGTRVVAVLAWIYALSLIQRALLVTFGMDTMLAIVLFYLMLAPSGARLSLDRLIDRYRRSRYALAGRSTPVSLEVPPSVAANVALRLFQIHFCIIYINSGSSKLQGPAWWNGTALWQTASNYEFTPVQSHLYTDALRGLTQVRPLWEVVMTSGDLFTLVLEIGLPFLIWYPRWRPLMLAGAVLLHVGIGLNMGLTAFSMLMIIILGGFLPAGAVRAMLDRLLRTSGRFTLLANVRESAGLRTAALVRAADVTEQVRIVDLSTQTAGIDDPAEANRPVLTDEAGHTYRGYALFERLTRSLRLWWPLGLLTWVPGVGRLGRVLGAEGVARPHREAAGVGS